jgi:hypothetical protein
MDRDMMTSPLSEANPIPIAQYGPGPGGIAQSGEAPPENPFSCNVCKRTYTRVDHLARHYRSRRSLAVGGWRITDLTIP